jgi:hypothetical protein
LGVRRRYNGLVHPGAGYPAGLRRVSGLRTPCATTRPGRGASERSAYSVDVSAVEACRQPQEQATGMLAMRCHRSSQERVPTETCQGGGRQRRLEEGLCSRMKRLINHFVLGSSFTEHQYIRTKSK